MRLTKQSNYAVRILMYCASNDSLSKIADIAEFYDISETFLFKILQILNNAGFVETVRGRHGGIKLKRDSAEIGLGEVIRATEDNFDMAECFDLESNTCPLIGSCGFNHALHRALTAFFDVLDEYTIADLTDNRRNIRVLLELDSAVRSAPKRAEA
ncbi:iron-responsive transcriptional regulator RirA [Maritalea sp. S77]|uniref:iron-responsive transcriptional regulator RirA n=1 Tax=Maritalea sp. S77 TaxID=3415125 RepID=UPI003C7B8606